MSKLATVAIIGRPNTGKSTLFNRLVGKRRAIESEVAGTTRDLISHRIDDVEIPYLLLDTGGIGSTADKDFEEDVKGQSRLALEHADVILFTVNSKCRHESVPRTSMAIWRSVPSCTTSGVMNRTAIPIRGFEDVLALDPWTMPMWWSDI